GRRWAPSWPGSEKIRKLAVSRTSQRPHWYERTITLSAAVEAESRDRTGATPPVRARATVRVSREFMRRISRRLERSTGGFPPPLCPRIFKGCAATVRGLWADLWRDR